MNTILTTQYKRNYKNIFNLHFSSFPGRKRFCMDQTMKIENYNYFNKILTLTVIFIIGFCCCSPAQMSKTLSTLERQEMFVNKSYEKVLQQSSDEELKKRYDSYIQNPDSKNFSLYEKRTTEVSLMKDIMVTVKITTAKEGALVRYKPLDGSEPFTGNEPTNNCILKLPLGYCIIWTERGGTRTSNARTILVIDDETVFIEEIQKP